jgi:hypothetical protein
VGGHQIDGGQVAGAVALDLAGGDLADELVGLHRQVAGLGGGNPRLDVGRLGAAQGDALAQALQRVGLLAGEHQQRVALDGQVALGGDHLGRGQVGAGLGFMDVGDGDGADLEALLGQGQLLGVGLVEGLGGGQHVLGAEHVEVGLGCAQGEILDGPAGTGHRPGPPASRPACTGPSSASGTGAG